MDAPRRSRAIRLLNDYIVEGLVPRPSTALSHMTDREIEDLIEAARQKRETAEAGEAPQPEPAPEPPTEGQPTMPEEGNENQISEQEFFDKYPTGTHVMLGGDEHVVTGHVRAHEGDAPYLRTVLIGEDDTITLQYEHDEEIMPCVEPTKIPQRTEYPPQVFLYAYDDDGTPNASIHKDHQSLAAAYPSIDGDSIMEAISDPGQPISVGDGTLVYLSID